MRIKVVSSSRVFDGRVNCKMKWSAEALMIVSEVTEQPSFSEADVAELIDGVTDKITLKMIWHWLKTEGAGADTPQVFFEKLGFRAAELSADEKANLKTLLGKFVRPKLAELEEEKIELSKRIESLTDVIEMTKNTN